MTVSERDGVSRALLCTDEAVLTRMEYLRIRKLEERRIESRLRKPDVWRRDGRVVSVRLTHKGKNC